jgi:phage terminase large subunit-like protein
MSSKFSEDCGKRFVSLVPTELSRRRLRRIDEYYPDSGPLRRELYPKHTAFFAAGAEHRERLMIAANRVGKTEGVGAYETACHLTGEYPDWWTGARFEGPIKAWAAGDTSKTVREIVQAKLLGSIAEIGTGMIPGAAIVDWTAKSGVTGAIDQVFVRHKSGGTSLLTLKSYDQKRESFQGTEQHVIWLDEEPPEDIYTECVMRTMATGGFGGGWLLLTFTPLEGWTEVVDKYLCEPVRVAANRYCVTATWDDAPHLSREEKARLWATLPAYQRDARSKGIPSLGSGAIYPVPEEDLIEPDIPIPPHWPRVWGLDVAWNCTAAVWAALDRDSDVLHLYSEHKRGEAEPSIHAEAIKRRGKWIRGVIDPAARGRSQVDGRQLLQMYRDLGLDVEEAVNSVEAGIYEVWQRMSTGRLKVFRSLAGWAEERRRYRRDEKGRIVKEFDHLMDATRYLVMSGLERARTEPKKPQQDGGADHRGGGWMS